MTLLATICALCTSSAQEAERIFASSERAVFTVETPKKTGTGFVLSGGFFVTCYHVVKGAGARIKLRESPTARLSYLAHDEKADIAVFALDSAMPSYLRIGEGTPNVGATVYVIGTPLGALDRSISNGIISQVRSISGVDLLQLTAAISPGSSGSPVLDAIGQVVGMVTGYLKEGQANNFAVSSAVISRVIASRGAAKAPIAPISQIVSKHLKTTGQLMNAQFVRPSALYREPNLSAEPLFYVRAKRITTAQRTVAAEWVAVKLTNGSIGYAPSKDIKLYDPKDKASRNLIDPLNVSPPKGFDKLISDIGGSDGEISSAAETKLLSYGPGIVKHVLAKFELAFDNNAYSALLSLAKMGSEAKPAFRMFLDEGSETQKEAMAALLEFMTNDLSWDEYLVRDEPKSDALDKIHREEVIRSIKRLSWLRDGDFVKYYAVLLASDRTKKDALKILGNLQLKQYKSEIIQAMQSKNFDLAASGFEAFCRIANDMDSPAIKRQFDRIAAIDPQMGDLIDKPDEISLVISLGYSRNEACYKVLLDLLDNENEWVRKNCCECLKYWPREETIGRMSPLVKDKSKYVRTEAIMTLCRLSPDRFINEAISLSKSNDSWDRSMAAHALAGTKLDRAAPHLELLCEDEEESVRETARLALQWLGTPTAVRALIHMLDSSDPAVRKEARAALKELGKEPPPTFSQLKTLSLFGEA